MNFSLKPGGDLALEVGRGRDKPAANGSDTHWSHSMVQYKREIKVELFGRWAGIETQDNKDPTEFSAL